MLSEGTALTATEQIAARLFTSIYLTRFSEKASPALLFQVKTDVAASRFGAKCNFTEVAINVWGRGRAAQCAKQNYRNPSILSTRT